MPAPEIRLEDVGEPRGHGRSLLLFLRVGRNEAHGDDVVDGLLLIRLVPAERVSPAHEAEYHTPDINVALSVNNGWS